MSMNKLGKGLLIVATSTLLFACASKEEEEVTPVEPVVVEQPPAPPAKTPEQLAQEANDAARQARVVYFDFDDDSVTAEARAIIEAHAWFLSKAENSGITVTVEGHCDERGTPAYNLALGERRAKSVAQILMLNGVSASQIQTVSHGEEKPAADGHDESAWSQNRRGVLSYYE